MLAVSIFGDADWFAEGPSPQINAGNTDGPDGNGEFSDQAVGSVNAIAVDPTNSNHVFVASTNGGIWETENRTATLPRWTTTTDELPSLAIGSIAIDPVDTDIIYAGTGRFSSFGSGGMAVGVYKSIDGGDTWQWLNPGGMFSGLRIDKIIPTAIPGLVFLSSPDNGGGVFVSKDGGANWQRLSGSTSTDMIDNDGDGVVDNPEEDTGLPDAGVSDLVQNPLKSHQFFAAVPAASSVNPGIYQLDLFLSSGWRNVSSNVTTTSITTADLNASLRIELSISPAGDNPIWASIINTGGYLQRVYRGVASGGTISWSQVGPPGSGGTRLAPTIYGNARPQGNRHSAIVADPIDDTLVYLGGDANDKTTACYIVRGDSDSNTWTALTPVGTVTNPTTVIPTDSGATSAPHADARDLVFATNFRLLIATDGGIYEGTDVRGDTSEVAEWTSRNGSLQITEFYNIAYDNQFDINFGGAQDNGNPSQTFSNSYIYWDESGGDGGATAVDNLTFDDRSVRYFFGTTRKQFTSARNRVAGDKDASILPQAGLLDLVNTKGNRPRTVVNAIGPTDAQRDAGQSTRIAVAGVATTDMAGNLVAPGVIYESNNAGSATGFTKVGKVSYVNNVNWGSSTAGGWMTGTKIPTGPGFWAVNRRTGGDVVMAYGGRRNGVDNPDVLYAASRSQIYLRTTAGGTLTATNAQPMRGSTPAGSIAAIALDPDNWWTAYVTDNTDVWMTRDRGDSWTRITGNLTNRSSGALDARLAVISGVGGGPVPGVGIDALLLGGSEGVFRMRSDAPGAWTEFGPELPNVIIGGMVYDKVDDELVVGTFGRGVWTVSNASDVASGPPVTIDVTGDENGVTDDEIEIKRNPDYPLLLEIFVNDTNEPVFSGLADEIASITVNPGDGHNTITVNDLPEGTQLALNGGSGDDDYIIGGGAFESRIRSTFGIFGASGFDTLTIDNQDNPFDAANLTTRYTLERDEFGIPTFQLFTVLLPTVPPVVRFLSVESVTINGSDSANERYNLHGVGADITVSGAGGTDMFNLFDSDALVTLNGGSGTNTYNVGDGDYFANIGKAVTINGGTASDHLTIDDKMSNQPLTSIDSYYLDRQLRLVDGTFVEYGAFVKGRIMPVSPEVLSPMLAFAGVDDVTLEGSLAPDIFNVNRTFAGVAYELKGNDNRDTFNVGAGNYQARIRGAVTIDGGDGSDELVIDDRGDTLDDRYVLGLATVVGMAGGYFTKDSINVSDVPRLEFADVASIELEGSDANNTFDIEGVPNGASVTVNGHDGVDQVNVGDGNYFDDVRGPVTVHGGSDGDALFIDDGDFTVGPRLFSVLEDNYTIGPQTFQKSITERRIGGENTLHAPTLSFDGMAGVTLDASRLGGFDIPVEGPLSTIEVNGVAEGATLMVNANSGDDEIVITDVSLGATLIASGDEGVDTFRVNGVPEGFIEVHGGDPTRGEVEDLGDRLFVNTMIPVDDPRPNGEYGPDPNDESGGEIFIDGRKIIDFGGLEPITVAGFDQFTLVSPGSGDDIVVGSPEANQTRVDGVSDGLSFENLNFFKVTEVVLDLARNDDENPEDRVMIQPGALAALGLQKFTILTGTGESDITVLDSTVPVTVVTNEGTTHQLVVTNTNDSGPGSLRAAIDAANAISNEGLANILFHIPDTDPGFVDVDAHLTHDDADDDPDVFVISPLTALPALTRGNIVINGQSQQSATGDTNPFGPEIVLAGNSAGAGVSGLQLASSDNLVHGLNVQQFGGDGVLITADENTLTGNYIGTNAIGNASASALPGIVGWWPGNGNADDVAGNHDGTLVNGTTFAPGMVEQAFSFDGVDDYVATPLVVDYTDGVTFELWVNTTDESNSTLMAGGGGATASRGMGLFIEPGGLLFLDGTKETPGENNFLIFGPSISDGVFHHIAATWTGDTTPDGVRLYLDGELIGTTTAMVSIENDGTAMYLGDHPNFYLPLNGQIDEPTIYSRVLSTNEIAQIYSQGSAGKLPANPGNGGNGVHIVDSSGVLIGGTDDGARNVISGNSEIGVSIVGAGPREFDDKDRFLATTGAVDVTGDIPNLGAFAGDVTIGELTFRPVDGSLLHVGALGVTFGGNPVNDWYEPRPGNEIALTHESFNVDLPAPAHSFGFEFVEPDATMPPWGGNPVESEFEATLLLGSAEVDSFTFSRDNDVVTFVGFTSPHQFDRVEIRETSGTNDDEYFGRFFVGTMPVANTVQGNVIGLAADGVTPLGNGSGINITNSSGNVIGGTADAARNVISASTIGYGIIVQGTGSTENLVEGNYIGTDVTGTLDRGNASSGVLLQDTADNTLRGNVISGNGVNGVFVVGSTPETDMTNTIEANYIGTDASGTQDLGNTLMGVRVLRGVGTIVRGNVLSGNDNTNMFVDTFGSNVLIEDNLVGTDHTGNAALQNPQGLSGFGVTLVGRNNHVIGNVISGNPRDGVTIDALNSSDGRGSGNVFQRNLIGLGLNSAIPLPNTGNGIRIWRGAHNNTIGTDGDGIGHEAEGNSIAYNTGTGVLVIDQGSVGNTIRGNSIYSNGGLGIDLGGDGPTPNDELDTDVGPNLLQNFPELKSIKSDLETKIVGHVKSSPNDTFIIDFYASSMGDPSGFGEGTRWLGSAQVVANEEGTASFNVTLPKAIVAGEVVTATATDADGNTSEFSASAEPQIKKTKKPKGEKQLAAGEYAIGGDQLSHTAAGQDTYLGEENLSASHQQAMYDEALAVWYSSAIHANRKSRSGAEEWSSDLGINDELEEDTYDPDPLFADFNLLDELLPI